MSLLLGKPNGRRRSFRIQRKVGSRIETIKHPTLQSINLNYLKGLIDLQTAEKNVRELIKQLAPKQAIIHNKDNERLLERYWENEYSHRELIDPSSERYALERAIRACGNLSLQSVTREALQKHINLNFKGNKQRRIVSKLNQLLRWLKRDFQLLRNREEFLEVPFLTHEQFLKILPFLSEPQRLLHEVCFYGGFRIGEAFALEEHTFNRELSSIKVLRQVDNTGVRRQTKNRKQREAYVFPEGHLALENWFKNKDQISLKDRTQMSKITRSACRKAKVPECRFHDLRHSYAIRLLSSGVSVGLVAQSIGDSVRVVEKHYTGFILTSDSVRLIGSLISKKVSG